MSDDTDAALERIRAAIAERRAIQDAVNDLRRNDYHWPQSTEATEPTMNKDIDILGSAIHYVKIATAMVATAGLVVVTLIAALYNLYVVFSGKESLTKLFIATPLLVVLVAGCLAVIGAWASWLDK